jgi:pyruvate formate-lyase/glycerol dehydratase family glycyl radical enzyme
VSILMEPTLIQAHWKLDAHDLKKLNQLKEHVFLQRATLCSERALFYTKVFLENQEDPYILKKAKAFAYTLQNMSLYVVEDSRIVGNIASKMFAAPIFPEYSIGWIRDELDTFEHRSGDVFYVDNQVKKDIVSIIPSWENQTHQDNVYSKLTSTIKEASSMNVLHLGGISMSGDGHIVPDYPLLLSKGFRAIIQEANEHLNKTENAASKVFYKSTIIVLEAALDYFKRYAAYCKKLADTTNDKQRKEQLLKLSDICSTLMELPAQSYYEALQAVFMVHVLLMIESNGHSFCFGRFDQYMIDYYTHDLEHGILSVEEALVLTTHFFIMSNTLNKIRPNNHTKYSQGYPLYSNLMISGKNLDGTDSTNALSYLCVEAMNLTSLPHPNFSMRYHTNTPDKLLDVAAQLIRKGFGMPALFNDEVAIKGLLDLGIEPQDAYDYCAIGCVETGVPGKYGHRATGMTYVNWGKLLELVLHNGIDPNTKKSLLSVDDNQPEKIEYKTYQELFKGWEKLLTYYTDLAVESDRICDESLVIYDASPFASCFIDNCLEHGKTIKEGGCKYDVISQSNIGSSVVGNSLYTYQQLVFETKKYTCTQLYDAMEDNWSSMDSMMIKKDIKALAKFGNDEDDVDQIVASVFESYLKLLPKYTTARSNQGPLVSKYTMSTSNITSYVPNGLEVGATPDGRFAYDPLNEGCSPTQGSDTHGPTAVLKSVSKLPNDKVAAGQLLNMRFSPSALAGEANFNKFKALLKASVNLGIYHNQFNVIHSDTLKLAQHTPEHYQDLIVRVAGYCAQFVALTLEAQDAIIARSENGWH